MNKYFTDHGWKEDYLTFCLTLPTDKEKSIDEKRPTEFGATPAVNTNKMLAYPKG